MHPITRSTAAMACAVYFITFLVLIYASRLFSQWMKRPQQAEKDAASSGTELNHSPDLIDKSHLDNPDEVRALYHKLHHLEDHPDILLTAKDVLLQALDRAIITASLAERERWGILNMYEYSRESLAAWVIDRDRLSMQRFKTYSSRRAAGGPRQLMETHMAAKKYLQAQAPLRYVDGAWLGRLSRARAPWKHQKTLRQLWQISSEELGDGDLTKHHTHIYRRLLLSLEPEMPAGHSADFISGQWGADDECVWRSALMQLLISLFQEDFLPEILGFNLHFEGLTAEMMIASVEMRELGLDPSYFLLHVSIDNADSGHTAMALDAVCDYIEQCRERDGPKAAEIAWRRVQAGYLLSEGRWNVPEQSHARMSSSRNDSAVADMFARKAEAGAADVHCASQTLLSGRRIIDWLTPTQMADPTWRTGLVRALARSRYWITPGDSSSSRFMRELLWPGRMFGAFTDTECQLVERWIRQLSVPCDGAYSAFVGIDQRVAGTANRIANIKTKSISCFDQILRPMEVESEDGARPCCDAPTDLLGSAALSDNPYLPTIWFAHLCLLEGFTALPSKNGNAVAQSAIRILRAHNALNQPTHSVTGTDTRNELTDHPERITMIDVGLQLLTLNGLDHVQSLTELLDICPCDALVDVIMDVSTVPDMRSDVVLGMASGFTLLYESVAKSGILDVAFSQQLLAVAAVHEREAAFFMHEHDSEALQLHGFVQGAEYIRRSLQRIFAA